MGSETLYYKCRTYTVHSDKCRTYKSPFGQVQNLQKPIRTSAELTKAHSDKCRTYKSPMKSALNSVDTSLLDALPMKMLLTFICNPSDRQITAVGSASKVRYFISFKIHATIWELI